MVDRQSISWTPSNVKNRRIICELVLEGQRPADDEFGSKNPNRQFGNDKCSRKHAERWKPINNQFKFFFKVIGVGHVISVMIMLQVTTHRLNKSQAS